ncbi:MAG: LamG domain-containing protein [Verrucomicrobia bacterium]|nr:LamG domain-containing protein [Verrucomicrobiota bacterium]
MPKTTRRRFLKRTGSGTLAITSLALSSSKLASLPAGARPPSTSTLPKHQALDVPGLHAYPLEHSLPAGEMLELCVSSTARYDLSIRRLGVRVDDPESDIIMAEFRDQPAVPQPIHPGSYVHVAKALSGSMDAFTVECWVRPWMTGRLQGVVSQEDKESDDGFALGLGEDGYVGFFMGDGVSPDEKVVHRTARGVVIKNKWHHLAATWDGREKKVYVNGELAGTWPFPGPFKQGSHPIRLGALSQGGAATHFLDGDIAMPALHAAALSQTEIQERVQLRGLQQPRGRGLLACWPLNEERGDAVKDVSASRRHGRIINLGTWMIGGPSFKAAVPRFGDYKPSRDKDRGHGLRLASDDLYDCRWTVTHRWKIPSDARSGIYTARMRFEFDGKERFYHCTFLVRRAPRKRKSPILFVCATNTWRAYSGTPFAITPVEQKAVWGTGGHGPDRGLPSYCLYRSHAAGQGTYQMGLRMPWPAAGPYVLYGGATDYSHLMRADRFPQAWLEEQGYDYDLVSDVDLHRDPGMLHGYKTVMIVGHNEYWSIPMYRGIESYLRTGGNLAVLSGNTLGWRVSFNEDCTVMECRKVDAPGDQVPKSRRGEAWHSQDGLRGGPARECGIPGCLLIGLDIIGWNHPANPRNFGPYLVERADHFLFHHPEKSGLKAGDAFGWAGEGRMPMANGHEVDIRLSTFAALQSEPSPEGGIVPPDPKGIVRIANGVLPWKEGGHAMDYFFRQIQPKTYQGGEMIWWERPGGGRVFNAGAIGSGWLLHLDPKWAAVMRNVLHHFGVRKV